MIARAGLRGAGFTGLASPAAVHVRLAWVEPPVFARPEAMEVLAGAAQALLGQVAPLTGKTARWAVSRAVDVELDALLQLTVRAVGGRAEALRT